MTLAAYIYLRWRFNKPSQFLSLEDANKAKQDKLDREQQLQEFQLLFTDKILQPLKPLTWQEVSQLKLQSQSKQMTHGSSTEQAELTDLP